MDNRTKIFKILFSVIASGISLSFLLLAIFTFFDVPYMFEQLDKYLETTIIITSQDRIASLYAAIWAVVAKCVLHIFLSLLSALSIAYIWLKGKLKKQK